MATPINTQTKLPVPLPIIKPIPKLKGNLQTFMHRMGKFEGLGSYNTVSKTGYLGLYSFHPKTLQSMGFNMSKEDFLHNPAIQDSAMISYLRMNAIELHTIINKFNGTYYKNIYITKSGILAGAHLIGSAGIKAFFYPMRYSYRTVDGNGVSVEQYMKKFATYDLRGL